MSIHFFLSNFVINNYRCMNDSLTLDLYYVQIFYLPVCIFFYNLRTIRRMLMKIGKYRVEIYNYANDRPYMILPTNLACATFTYNSFLSIPFML